MTTWALTSKPSVAWTYLGLPYAEGVLTDPAQDGAITEPPQDGAYTVAGWSLVSKPAFSSPERGARTEVGTRGAYTSSTARGAYTSTGDGWTRISVS